MNMNTVNVIELLDNTPQSLRAFPDTPEGNKAAEMCFRTLYTEHNDPDGTTDFDQPTDEDFAAMFDDGVYDDECGYKICIVHSETP